MSIFPLITASRFRTGYSLDMQGPIGIILCRKVNGRWKRRKGMFWNGVFSLVGCIERVLDLKLEN
jgi:hypothetical protein